MRRLLIVVLLAAAATAPSDGAAAQTLRGLGFRGEADAFPVEPAPGRGEQSLGARPFGTRVTVSNPPRAGYALAAASDLGLTEAYTGPQGPRAETDTTTENTPDDAQVNQGATRLEAHSDRRPTSRALAIGSGQRQPGLSFGSSSSSSVADGSGRALVVTADAEVHDVGFGTLHIGSARFSARVSVNGRPGGAKASGHVEATDATVNGVPVTIGPDGVRVDEERVPAAQVPQLSRAVGQALSQGGYSSVRVVQPEIEVARDGSRAVVSGGGVRVFFTNADPANLYFLAVTLVGGSASAFTGASIGGSVGAPAAPGAAGRVEEPSVAGDAPAGNAPSDDAPDASSGAGQGAPTVRLLASQDGGTRRLPGPWRGWPFFVAVVVSVLGGWGLLRTAPLAPWRGRLAAALDDVSDRYLRG